jgi:hypothetical protein
MKVRCPRSHSRRIDSVQRTDPVTCRSSIPRISSGSDTTDAPKLHTTGMPGACTATPASSAASWSCADCIRRL